MNSTKNKFSIAPMLDWTDKHCRYFHRVLTKQTLLYTEMVTTGAILFGKGDYLDFNHEEHPVSLQLGGSDPKALAQCAKLAQERGYDEINLNVGCPSDRVQNGMFGACLMGNANLVADCVEQMQAQVDIPVTVKTRIGIDDFDSYAFLCHFIETVMPYTSTFIVHARKAWLSGLSPKENREVPPLNYDRVYKLKQDYPNLTIAINGGIKTIDQIKHHLQHVDGVMVGREAYQNPLLLTLIDSQIFGLDTPTIEPKSAIRALYPYIEQQLTQGAQLNHIMRHTLGLFNGFKGARQWRRYLSENAHKKGVGIEVVEQALTFIR
ncbi:tRNA dihydrouridine(20/20a) synthase DusA [Gilliamella intestini]|jgi:tRNA-dihydrouridine synthase A|uniref:tRNA-dihydrouridine(20/20a) synthase n=1 Tax=Gilliamella intestini TaxID=1798183 RepID=A0A1C4CJF9_9GAMM|nr:tRNA dihydrouridine(20/20a) synthase DusA [Gilliamella intestini]SCC19280.1 tRNA-U16,U17-dihydrouridine synthase [Gilliamella intestini]